MKLEFINMEIKQERYHIEFLPIQKLCYKVISALLEKDSIYLQGNRLYKIYLETMERLLPNGPPFGFGKGWEEWEEKAIKMHEIYKNIKETEKLWNPFIVMQQRDGNFYIILGGQRLCSLRALHYTGELPCRVLHFTDAKAERSNPAILIHPYVLVPNITQQA